MLSEVSTMFPADPLFDKFAVSIGLGLGGQAGEILATCAGIADGDDSAWHDAWSATGDRLTRSILGRRPQRPGGRRAIAAALHARRASANHATFGMSWGPWRA
jgi:hypothetical protein